MRKAGIVGCGSIGQVHGAAVQGSPHIELGGAADIVPEKAEKLTAQFGGHAYASMEELLEAEHPDVIHICTPHFTHVPLAVKALRSGAHVLLEKPPAITLDDIPVLAQAQRESGRRLGLCFQNRYRDNYRRARELVTSRALGPVKGARAFVTWRRGGGYYTDSPWRGRMRTEGGGVMINQAIHTLDLMLWLLGDPQTVAGSVANHHLPAGMDVEDTAEAVFSFDGGVSGLFYASTANSGDDPVYLDVACEEGHIIVEGDSLTLRGPDGRLREYFENPPVKLCGKACWGGMHAVLIEDFYAHLDDGNFPIGIAEGSRALRALLCLYRASQEGRAVDFATGEPVSHG